jgi:hypothetical protein
MNVKAIAIIRKCLAMYHHDDPTVILGPIVEPIPCIKSLPDQDVQEASPVDGSLAAVQVDEKASI